MNILLFARAATSENPSMCPFITRRVFELQQQGHRVTVLQSGNLEIKNHFSTERKGILRLVTILYKMLRLLYHLISNCQRVYRSEEGTFTYYDRLSFRSYKSFYKWYKKNDFDLIHAHFIWYSKPLPFLKKLFGIPYVVTVHGSDMHKLTPYDRNDVKEMLEVLDCADCCIFVSQFLLSHARSLGFTGCKNRIIYNGINFSYFYPGKEKNGVVPLLGFVGHPNFIKRAYILPMVLRLVRQKIPGARMLLLGSEQDDLLPFIKFMAWKLELADCIDFVPAVPPEQVAEYMRKIDVLLLPSHNEGFPCVTIEAQACGIGVVASANGGIPEAVGKNGICVPESENFIKDFSDAVVRYLSVSHDASQITRRVKDFSWENCVKKEIDVYSTVINNGGGYNTLADSKYALACHANSVTEAA